MVPMPYRSATGRTSRSMPRFKDRVRRLLDVRLRVGPVVLVQVDVVGLQPPQRVLDLGDDPLA
jgi:hypothetical protein